MWCYGNKEIIGEGISADYYRELEVRLENETVWLNRAQISLLFDRDVKTIGKHINSALITTESAIRHLEEPRSKSSELDSLIHCLPLVDSVI